MSLKRNFFFSFNLFLFLLTVFVFTLAGLLFYLPIFLESRFIPELAANFGLPAVQCDVRRIGLTGADLGSLSIGDNERSGISVDSVQINYSPTGLYRREIERVLVSGITLNCEIKENEITLQGLDFKKLLHSLQPEKAIASETTSSQQIWIKNLKIRNAVVICEWQKNLFRLPFEIEGVSENRDQDLLQCHLNLFPRGEPIHLNADIDLNHQKILLKIDAADIQVDRFADLSKLIPGLLLSGHAAMQGKAEIDIAPFTLSSAFLKLQFQDQGSTYKHLKLRESLNSENKPRPVQLEINKDAKEDWKIFLNAIALDSEIPLKISDIAITSKIKPDAVECSGNFNIAIEKSKPGAVFPVKMMNPVFLNGMFASKFSKNLEWEFNVTGKGTDQLFLKDQQPNIRINTLTISSNTPVFDLSGQGNTSEGTLKCSVAVPAVHGEAKPAKVKIPVLSFKAETFFNKTNIGIKNWASCHLTAQNTNLNLNSINCKIPTLSLDGTWKENSGGTPQFDGDFKIKSGRVYDRKTKAQLRSVNVLLPVKWPVGGTASKGNISVKAIHWENRDIGSIKGSIQQKGPELVFNAKLDNTLFPGVSIKSSGKSKIFSDPNPETRIRYNISNDLSAPDMDWGRILPQAKGIKSRGEFSIAGIVEADAKGIRHSLKADVINTQVRQEDADFTLEGMNMDLFLSDVLNMKSAPAQKLTFKKASLGNLDLTHGSFNFQFENNQSIFIEKSSFNWCQGNVNTQSFRLLPGIADYDIILHCDRLNLAMLLEQLGVGIAAGKGTVNGKIPLRFQKGKLSFDDAFLYSTPGAGGKIYLTGTEILTAGIPSNTPQYAQIELVREALKDFDYEWAKVKLLTEDDNLLLKIQFDGKPATALPFVYKKELGGFARAEAGIKGSVFKGIRLDINLHLPLDKIMQYKNVYRLFF